MFPCTQHRQSSDALPKRLRSSSSSSVNSVCLNSMRPSLICELPTTGRSSSEQTCSVRQCCETHGPSLVDVRLWPTADLPLPPVRRQPVPPWLTLVSVFPAPATAPLSKTSCGSSTGC